MSRKNHRSVYECLIGFGDRERLCNLFEYVTVCYEFFLMESGISYYEVFTSWRQNAHRYVYLDSSWKYLAHRRSAFLKPILPLGQLLLWFVCLMHCLKSHLQYNQVIMSWSKSRSYHHLNDSSICDSNIWKFWN